MIVVYLTGKACQSRKGVTQNFIGLMTFNNDDQYNRKPYECKKSTKYVAFSRIVEFSTMAVATPLNTLRRIELMMCCGVTTRRVSNRS